MIKGLIFGKCYYYILNNYYTYVNVEDAKICILFILSMYTLPHIFRGHKWPLEVFIFNLDLPQ